MAAAGGISANRLRPARYMPKSHKRGAPHV